MEPARLAADPTLKWVLLPGQRVCELNDRKKVKHELDKKPILRRNRLGVARVG